MSSLVQVKRKLLKHLVSRCVRRYRYNNRGLHHIPERSLQETWGTTKNQISRVTETHIKGRIVRDMNTRDMNLTPSSNTC